MSPTAAIDGHGRYHIAATCNDVIRYASSTDGRTWKSVHFSLAAGRADRAPQLAVDGSNLYLAYTRLQYEAGDCGPGTLTSVGVYYRKRHLPDGAWSAPVRVGTIGGDLLGFRVVGGVIHELLRSVDGQGAVSYGRSDHGRFLSVVLPKARDASLRVGGDGRARIAYALRQEIRYATIAKEGRLSSTRVYRSGVMEFLSPSLVLGAGDRPYIAFTARAVYHGGGCDATYDTAPKPGTYFATTIAGAWRVRYLSRIEDSPSIVVDPQTGRVEVVVSYESGVRHLTRHQDGTWSGTTIRGSFRVGQALIRRDAKSGHLLIVGVRYAQAADIVAMIKS